MATSVINYSPKIIEQGANGRWKYRKWSNGVMEAWLYAWGETGTFAQWGSLFYRDVTGPTIPSGWFAEEPLAFLTPYGSQAAVFGIYSVTNTQIGKIRFIHNSSNSEACFANIYLYGYWR